MGPALWHSESAVGLRRVLALIRGLPVESSFIRDVLGDEAAWTIEAHLLANVVEVIDLARQGTVVGFAKANHKPKAVKIPRPGSKKKQRREATAGDMVAIFGAPGRN